MLLTVIVSYDQRMSTAWPALRRRVSTTTNFADSCGWARMAVVWRRSWHFQDQTSEQRRLRRERPARVRCRLTAGDEGLRGRGALQANSVIVRRGDSQTGWTVVGCRLRTGAGRWLIRASAWEPETDGVCRPVASDERPVGRNGGVMPPPRPRQYAHGLVRIKVAAEKHRVARIRVTRSTWPIQRMSFSPSPGWIWRRLDRMRPAAQGQVSSMPAGDYQFRVAGATATHLDESDAPPTVICRGIPFLCKRGVPGRRPGGVHAVIAAIVRSFIPACDAAQNSGTTGGSGQRTGADCARPARRPGWQ